MESINLTAVNITDAEALRGVLVAMQAYMEEQRDAIDTGWTLLSVFIIFFMQIGFGFLEAGSVSRKRSAVAIIMQNGLVTLFTAMVWWLVGFAFAYGEGNGFIGYTGFAFAIDMGPADTNLFVLWMFGWVFSAAAAAIVAGALAERTRTFFPVSIASLSPTPIQVVHMLYMCMFSAIIYAPVAHWVWADGGWMSAKQTILIAGNNFLDFAGSGVVHTVGGVAAFFAAFVVGPRLHRFEPQYAGAFQSQDRSLVTLGTFFLWFGWYGFNAGSTLALVGLPRIAAHVAVNTTLSAAFGGLTALVWARIFLKEWDLVRTCNGVLAGLVSITGGCAYLHSWAAVITGIIGGTLYYWSAWVMAEKMHVDDPVDASAIHGVCGMWGVIAPGLFAAPEFIEIVHGRRDHYGLFLGGGGYQLGMQLLGLVCLGAWAAVWSFGSLYFLKRINYLRTDPDKEKKAFDEQIRILAIEQAIRVGPQKKSSRPHNAPLKPTDLEAGAGTNGTLGEDQKDKSSGDQRPPELTEINELKMRSIARKDSNERKSEEKEEKISSRSSSEKKS